MQIHFSFSESYPVKRSTFLFPDLSVQTVCRSNSIQTPWQQLQLGKAGLVASGNEGLRPMGVV